MKNTLIKTISLAILTLLSFNTFVYASIGESVDIGEEYSILSSITYEEGMNVDAKSALLVEPVSGTVLYEKNSEEKFAPASVTKIMTMLLAIEAVDNGSITLSDKIVCSENAKNMGGSTMLLDTGEVRTVEEILKGIAIASGNDAAVALAEHVGGDIQGFANLMNKCYLIMTDSGGIQEEAPALGKPVVVLRTETERPEAVKAGTVKLAGVERNKIFEITNELVIDDLEYHKMAHAINPYGDGKACERIVELIVKHFE